MSDDVNPHVSSAIFVFNKKINCSAKNILLIFLLFFARAFYFHSFQTGSVISNDENPSYKGSHKWQDNIDKLFLSRKLIDWSPLEPEDSLGSEDRYKLGETLTGGVSEAR